ncbi:hypothetical protein K466DRAFT_43142 [Polyporus arcularius HHB13444]|uniref:Secreted protein n=1 Tax=Polyporus arcularius HHB13444 TaxID=1314778 RepID=A0A5C3NRJ7_9APHY|nr:hypothetical protein K466DRAFT_43142 [Polyporus arcularius HHB13444]
MKGCLNGAGRDRWDPLFSTLQSRFLCILFLLLPSSPRSARRTSHERAHGPPLSLATGTVSSTCSHPHTDKLRGEHGVLVRRARRTRFAGHAVSGSPPPPPR